MLVSADIGDFIWMVADDRGPYSNHILIGIAESQVENGFLRINSYGDSIIVRIDFLMNQNMEKNMWYFKMHDVLGMTLALNKKPSKEAFQLLLEYRPGKETELIQNLLNNNIECNLVTTKAISYIRENILYKNYPYNTILHQVGSFTTKECRTYSDFSGNPYDKYVGKFIKFSYASGKKPGTYRTIKVDTVSEDFITGIDLSETILNGKQEYRKYNIANIIGSITEVHLT